MRATTAAPRPRREEIGEGAGRGQSSGEELDFGEEEGEEGDVRRGVAEGAVARFERQMRQARSSMEEARARAYTTPSTGSDSDAEVVEIRGCDSSTSGRRQLLPHGVRPRQPSALNSLARE